MKRNSIRKLLSWAGYLLLVGGFLLSAGGCGGFDATVGVSVEDSLVALLNDAINKLSMTSADWQTVLQDLQDQLTADMKDIIGNDITNMITHAEGAAGAEARCNVDFIRTRVRRDLINLKASILHQEPVLEIVPYFCQPIPTHIDMTLAPDDRNLVEFYGFDFDTEPGVKFYHQIGRRLVDVSDCIDNPSYYMITLNLGGDCIVLSSESKRLIAKWNGKEYVSVGVIQPHPKICEQNNSYIEPGPLNFNPTNYYGGDKDYHGNGPDVDLAVRLSVVDGGIDANITMSVQETKDDWTEARGSGNVILYRPSEPGWHVVEIISPFYSNISYVDTDEKLDTEYPESTGPIAYANIMADAEGDKDADKTKAEIHFSRIYFIEAESENCVTKEEYEKLAQEGLLSNITISALQAIDWPIERVTEGAPYQYPTQNLPPGFKFILPTPTP